MNHFRNLPIDSRGISSLVAFWNKLLERATLGVSQTPQNEAALIDIHSTVLDALRKSDFLQRCNSLGSLKRKCRDRTTRPRTQKLQGPSANVIATNLLYHQDFVTPSSTFSQNPQLSCAFTTYTHLHALGSGTLPTPSIHKCPCPVSIIF